MIEYHITNEVITFKFPGLEVGGVYEVLEGNEESITLRKLEIIDVVDTRIIQLSNGMLIDFNTRIITDKNNNKITVSKTLWKMLDCFAKYGSNGRLVKRNTLLTKVWGDPYVSYTHILNVHMARLRAALGFDCVETVLGEGYRLAQSNNSINS